MAEGASREMWEIAAASTAAIVSLMPFRTKPIEAKFFNKWEAEDGPPAQPAMKLPLMFLINAMRSNRGEKPLPVPSCPSPFSK